MGMDGYGLLPSGEGLVAKLVARPLAMATVPDIL
jgi:hypothetical protein